MRDELRRLDDEAARILAECREHDRVREECAEIVQRYFPDMVYKEYQNPPLHRNFGGA
jgi:hypothetical protein